MTTANAEGRVTTTTLFAPSVRFTSKADCDFDAMMTWRAELELAYLDDSDQDVVAGYAEFLTLRVGEDSIPALLDSLSADAAHFAVLFDGDDVNTAVEQQFSDAPPFGQILIVTEVLVAAPVRGHDLGAWLVAEVIARIASSTDTLVLLYPWPAGENLGEARPEVVRKLARHWRRVGLVELTDFPEFLGQSTAFVALSRAREVLKRRVDDIEIAVPVDRLTEISGWTEVRHTFTEAAVSVDGGMLRP